LEEAVQLSLDRLFTERKSIVVRPSRFVQCRVTLSLDTSSHNREIHRPELFRWPYHGSGSWSTASYRGDQGWFPVHSSWYLWRKKWHWDRFSSQHFSYPLSVSFHPCSIPIHSPIPGAI